MAPPPERGQGSSSLAQELLAFADLLRAEGVAVGTSELLDSFAALELVDWREEAQFKGALAATLAKSQQDRRLFELAFDRFILSRTALRAHEQEPAPAANSTAPARLGEAELAALRARVAQALAGYARGEPTAEAVLRDLARYVIAALGAGGGSVGVDLQLIRRSLDLRPEPRPSLEQGDPRRDGVPRSALRHFEALLRRELEAGSIQRTGELPQARPLVDLARALPTNPLSDLASVQRTVAQLRRRLASGGHEQRGLRNRHLQLDMRRTVRASLQTGGVPIVIKERPRRPRRPEIFVICDVSTSVSAASVFFLSVLHALHDAFRKIRSFVFIERVAEITEICEREREFKRLSERISRTAGVADVSGYTDYGRVWRHLRELIEDDLDSRSTLLVLGDARTNGRDPGVADFAALAKRAGRVYWLNPEPRLYWNYGDSVMRSYEPYCRAYQCWNASQLETVVRDLTRFEPRPGS